MAHYWATPAAISGLRPVVRMFCTASVRQRWMLGCGGRIRHAYSLIPLTTCQQWTMTICVAACRLAILSWRSQRNLAGRRVANTGVCHYRRRADAEVADRDRIAMIAELANASGIAGTCAAVRRESGGRRPADHSGRAGDIHRHKTGALIRAAVRLGALSAER